MGTMAERYGTGNKNSYKGFGVPIKKKKKVVAALPPDSKIRTLPTKPGQGGDVKIPGAKKKPAGPSYSIGPMNPIAKKKRSNLGGTMKY